MKLDNYICVLKEILTCLVVHVLQQGESDLVHGVRTKSFDIHGSVAKGPMSDTFCKRKSGEIVHLMQQEHYQGWHRARFTPST